QREQTAMRSSGTIRRLAVLGVPWLIALAPAARAAEDLAAGRIIAAGRAESRVMEHLDVLCNRIGPRLTGSDNLRRACAWARRGGPRSDDRSRARREEAYAAAGIAGLVRPTRDELIVGGGNYRVDWDDLPETPTIDLVRSQWDEIAALLRDGETVVLEFDLR